MKFMIASGTLVRHLSVVSKAISAKTQLPILENVLIKASREKEEMVILASDIDVSIELKVKLPSIMESGIACVPAKLLLDALKQYPDMPMDFILSDDGSRFTVSFFLSNRKGEFSFETKDPEEFPPLPEIDESRKHTLQTGCESLTTGLTHTAFCASSDAMRSRAFNGVLIEHKEDGLRYVASDGSRIACYLFGAYPDPKTMGLENRSFFVSLKATQVITALLPTQDTDLAIYVDDKFLRFELRDVTFVCRLAENDFPEYEPVITQELPEELRVDTELLRNALMQINPFTNEARAIVAIDIEEKSMTLSADKTLYNASSQQTIDCDFPHEPRKIHVNGPSTAEILKHITTPETVICMSQTSKAAYIKPGNPLKYTGDDYHVTIMLLEANSLGY